LGSKHLGSDFATTFQSGTDDVKRHIASLKKVAEMSPKRQNLSLRQFNYQILS